jgi:hypothetical protein
VGVHRFGLTGVGPPLGSRLARLRDHRVQQDENLDRDPFADQWRAEAGERLGDEDHTGPFSDRVHDRVRVRGPTCRIIARRQ